MIIDLESYIFIFSTFPCLCSLITIKFSSRVYNTHIFATSSDFPSVSLYVSVSREKVFWQMLLRNSLNLLLYLKGQKIPSTSRRCSFMFWYCNQEKTYLPIEWKVLLVLSWHYCQANVFTINKDSKWQRPSDCFLSFFYFFFNLRK